MHPTNSIDPLTKKTGYRTKSMLAIPLANKQQEVIGVLQFINRKKARSLKGADENSAQAYTLPFDSDINVLLQASQVRPESQLKTLSYRKI
jgi:hypothetical protein